MARRNHGFTLLELIAVLAVIAILSSVMAPGIVRAVDDAYSRAEDENLETLASGLRDYILRTRSIPSTTGSVWSAALATNTDYSAQQILVNRRNQQRVLVADPRFFTSTDSSFSGYSQSTGLTSAPVSPRMMLISSLQGAVPSIANNSGTFDAVWNGDPSAAVVASDRIKIERINLSNVFRRVLLTNANSSQSAYALDANIAMPIPAATGSVNGMLSTYVIDGTQVSLFAAPYPSGALNTAALVRRDVSQAYQTDGGSWFWSAP